MGFWQYTCFPCLIAAIEMAKWLWSGTLTLTESMFFFSFFSNSRQSVYLRAWGTASPAALSMFSSTSQMATTSRLGWAMNCWRSWPPIPPTPIQAWASFLFLFWADAGSVKISGEARAAVAVVNKNFLLERSFGFLFI